MFFCRNLGIMIISLFLQTSHYALSVHAAFVNVELKIHCTTEDWKWTDYCWLYNYNNSPSRFAKTRLYSDVPTVLKNTLLLLHFSCRYGATVRRPNSSENFSSSSLFLLPIRGSSQTCQQFWKPFFFLISQRDLLMSHRKIQVRDHHGDNEIPSARPHPPFACTAP